MSMEMDDRPTKLSLPIDRAHSRFSACAIVALCATLLTGCDPAAQNTKTQSMRDLPNESLSTNSAPRQTGDTLVDKAQQDVDFFLRQRSAASNPAAADGSPILAESPGIGDQGIPQLPSTIEQAKIIWNEPSAIVPRETTIPNSTAATIIALESPGTVVTTTNAPIETASAPTVDDRALEPANKLITDLSRALYRDAAASDAPLRELMLIAATSIIDKDHAPSPTDLASLTERDRELLSMMQKFFAELGDQLSSAEDKDQAILASVSQLALALDRRPPLTIAHASLCTRVRGFGDFDEFDKTSFLAQAQQRIIVYLELDNFTSALNDQQQWVTELSQELVIYSDRDGIPVWSETWQSVVDVTRNKRKDFFTVQLVTLPPALSVGRYYLKVRMRDEKTGSNAEKSIAFEMVADPRMAAKSK